MRILYIADYPQIDAPPGIHGTYRRMEMFVSALKGIAQLDMLFYVKPGTDISPSEIARREEALSKRWNTKIKLFLCPRFSMPKWQQQWYGLFDFSKHLYFSSTSGSEQLSAFEACLDRHPDAIFAQRLQTMSPNLQTQRDLPRIFFDLDDIEHIKFIRELRQPPLRLRRFLYYFQIPALWWGERRAIHRAYRTFICSEKDYFYLSKQWKLPGIVVIPNSVSIPSPLPLTKELTLLLLGNYDYPPNAQAANFLIEKVFPLIHQVIPKAKLIIAGNSPHHIRTYRSCISGVEFAGFVESLDELYRRSRVVCCPIFCGGGTRVKMVEAAAYGKPIIASQIGAEGLEMVPDRDYLLRNSPQEFAQACIELLQDDILCTNLGNAARKVALQLYDRDKVTYRIQQLFRDEVAVNTSHTVISPN